MMIKILAILDSGTEVRYTLLHTLEKKTSQHIEFLGGGKGLLLADGLYKFPKVSHI